MTKNELISKLQNMLWADIKEAHLTDDDISVICECLRWLLAYDEDIEKMCADCQYKHFESESR